MVSVVYEAPESIQDAVSLLADPQTVSKAMAGGTDLIVQMNQMKSVDEERVVVDLKKIPGMLAVSLSDDELSLGPSVPCAQFTAMADVNAVYPGLIEAAYLIGSTQVQNRASVGGNLCNASPAADSIPVLIVNGAQCVIAGPSGERTVAAEDFVTGVGENCMAKGELLVRITIARPQQKTADAYLRFTPRTEMDIAVAGAGVCVTLDDGGTCTAARVAIGAVAPTALLVPEAGAALVGSKLDDDALEAAADAARAASRPITDRRGTADYRKQVVGVLVKRAARIAGERAGSRG